MRPQLFLALWGYAAVLAFLLSLWASFVIRQASLMGYAYRYDFLGVYVGARAVASGHGDQLYQVTAQRHIMDAAVAPFTRGTLMPFVFPGYVAVVLAPLAKLAYPSAFLTWSGVNLALAAWLIMRLGSAFAQTRRERLAVRVTLLASVPLLLTVLQGQLGMVAAVGIAETILAVRAGARTRAGLCLALGLLKPQLIVLPVLAFVAWRWWRALAAFCVSAVLLLAVSFAAAGPWIPPYLHFLGEYERSGLSYPAAMQNWRGAISVLLPIGRTAVAHWVTVGLTAGTVLFALFICWRRRPLATGSQADLSPEQPICLALVVLLNLLACPHLYLHDLVIGLPAGVLLWHEARRALAEWQPMAGPAWPLRTLIALLGIGPLITLAGQTGVLWGRLQIVPWYLALVALIAITAFPTAAHGRQVSLSNSCGAFQA